MRRNFLLLLSGAGAAQLVTLCLLPVLGRLYDAVAFGHLGVVMAVVSLSAVIVHGRYQMEIPLARAAEDASGLLVLAILLAFALSLPVAAIATLVSRPDAGEGMSYASLLAWAAALTLLTALLDIAAYWRSRRGRFGITARNGVVRNGSAGVAQIGASQLGSIGLLLGAIAGAMLAAIASVVDIARRDRAVLTMPRWSRLRQLAWQHRQHPFYGVPQGWVASLSWNLMPILLMRYSGAAVAGQYWVAYRILAAPVTLFNNAYRQASFPHFSERGLWPGAVLALRHSALIVVLGIVPVAVLYRFGSPLLSILMGPQWEMAGAIAGWMAIGILSDFLKVPVQCLLQSHARQRRLLVWEVAIVAVRYAAAFPSLANGRPIDAVAAFAIAGLAGRVLFLIVEILSIRAREERNA